MSDTTSYSDLSSDPRPDNASPESDKPMSSLALTSTSNLATRDGASLPALTPDGGLNRYLSEIRKFPMLPKDEEFMLAKR